MNEQEKFLQGLDEDKSQDLFEQPLEPEKAQEQEGQTEELDGEKLRNRRERRLAEKLQAEREAGIAMAERIKVLSEVKETNGNQDSDYLKSVERIYGTDSPEAIEATRLLAQALEGVEERATQRAYDRFAQEQQNERQEVQKAEQEIDSILEDLEEEHNVDLTTSSATRTAYLKLLERMSPKDADGNITQFADHHAVWEMYQSRNTKPTENRAKDLSSRSMVQSGASMDSNIQNDSTTRYLIENGLI